MQHIKYRSLNSKQQEIYNFQKIAAILADYGFNCIKLADDWQGADFLAYHFDGTTTLRVQLKGRITIEKKYLNKDLYMAFRVSEDWYLIPHDDLVVIIQQICNWLNTSSWIESGCYSAQSPSQELLKAIASFKLKHIACGKKFAQFPRFAVPSYCDLTSKHPNRQTSDDSNHMQFCGLLDSCQTLEPHIASH